MLHKQIALVSQSKRIKFSELAKAAAALQKQATRDLGPIWQIESTVDPFEKVKDVPVGYWPVIIKDKIPDDDEGFHEDKNNQPYALVKYGKEWPLTCSHEILEMLVDPFGRKMVTSDSIVKEQGRVQYLVEVCDPSEDAKFGYYVNGILLSDFYTPHYFDPVKSAGVRYSFTDHIKAPKQVLKGGYLSWYDPDTDEWYQADYYSTTKMKVVTLAKMKELTGSLRSRVDRLTKTPRLLLGVNKEVTDAATSHKKKADKSSASLARVFARQKI